MGLAEALVFNLSGTLAWATSHQMFNLSLPLLLNVQSFPLQQAEEGVRALNQLVVCTLSLFDHALDLGFDIHLQHKPCVSPVDQRVRRSSKRTF